VGLAWLIVHHFDDSIYRSQIRSRADTEARRIMAGLPLLATIPTGRAMSAPRVVLPASTSVQSALEQCLKAEVPGAPVVDSALRFEGVVAVEALSSSTDPKAAVGPLADAGAPAISLAGQLDTALESITAAHTSWVPVLDDDRRVAGTLSISDLVGAYRRELLAAAQRVSALGTSPGAFEFTVTASSDLAGESLRAAALPDGTLVTSIARGGQVLAPTGDFVLEPGDRLSLLGPSDLSAAAS
jgi:CIC family chloride channel protein